MVKDQNRTVVVAVFRIVKALSIVKLDDQGLDTTVNAIIIAIIAS